MSASDGSKLPLGLGVSILAMLAPWTTWFLWTTPDPNAALIQSPMWLFVVGTLILFGAHLTTQDRPLGCLVMYVALIGAPSRHAFAFEMMYVFTLGAFVLTCLQTMDVKHHRLVVWGLVLSASLQSLYTIVQWVGYDPIWHGWVPIQKDMIRGTTGNSNFLGAFLAPLAVVAPLVTIPVLLIGIVISGVLLSTLAVGAGLLVQYRQHWRWTIPCVVLIASGAVLMRTRPLFDSFHVRLDIWALAFQHQTWWTWLFGHGPGSWMLEVPVQQFRASIHTEGLFLQAHNEFFQWGYEVGLIGLALLVWWGWTHRAALRGPYAGGVVAVFVSCLGMFPFHLAIPGLSCLVILGLATSKEHGNDTRDAFTRAADAVSDSRRRTRSGMRNG